MIGKKTEWMIRISGGVLFCFALYKLYSRPLTHSYHEAFFFPYLQLILWFMLLLILILVGSSFSAQRDKWITAIVSVLLLAPYPYMHQTLSKQAEKYFFQQRLPYFEQLAEKSLKATVDEEELYEQLAALDVRSYEQGQNYIAYWVDRMPEQRDGFIYLLEGELPSQLFGYPVRQSRAIGPNWYSFSSQ